MGENMKDIVIGGHPPLDVYQDQEYLQRMDVVKGMAWRGEYPIEDILEELEDQFSNYNHLDISEQINYVDIFFDQLQESIAEILEEDDEFLEDQLEYLDILYNDFIDMVRVLFQRRLSISLNFLDNNLYDVNAKNMISVLYDFFILQSRKNWKKYFTKKVLIKLKSMKLSDNTDLVSTINELLEDMDHSLAEDQTIEEFLSACTDKYTKDMIYEYFEENLVSGNFLVRYSPQFYKNPQIIVDILDDVVTTYMYQKEKE